MKFTWRELGRRTKGRTIIDGYSSLFYGAATRTHTIPTVYKVRGNRRKAVVSNARGDRITVKIEFEFLRR